MNKFFETLSGSRVVLWVAATLKPNGATSIDGLRTMPDREGDGVCLLEKGEVLAAVKQLRAAGMNVSRCGDRILATMRPSEMSLIEIAWNTHFEESI